MSINELDFLYISSWNYEHMERYLMGWIKRYGLRGAMKLAMQFRYNLQKALAKYSKMNPNYDGKQENALMLIESIYRIMGRAYVVWARKEVVKAHPNLAKYPQKIKNLANGWWNRYVKKFGGAY